MNVGNIKINKPLKIAINTCWAKDRAGVALKNVKELTSYKANKFNTLELMNFGEDHMSSYSGLSKENVRTCLGGYFYERELVREKKEIFDLAGDVVLCGGRMNGELKWGIASLIGIKLQGLDKNALSLLNSKAGYSLLVKRDKDAIEAQNIQTPLPFNIHIYTKAIYVNFSEFTASLGKGSWKFGSQEEAASAIKFNRKEYDQLIFDILPMNDHGFFRSSGLNIRSSKDLVDAPEKMSKGEGHPINIFYWSGLDKMDEYFEKQVFPFVID